MCGSRDDNSDTAWESCCMLVLQVYDARKCAFSAKHRTCLLVSAFSAMIMQAVHYQCLQFYQAPNKERCSCTVIKDFAHACKTSCWYF